MGNPATNSLGVYVQVPFCQTKCTYCNFHTGVVSSDRFSPYIEAVSREIRERRRLFAAAGIDAHRIEGLPVDTVYVGGGTPSLLEPRLLESMLRTIRDSFEYHWREATLEADPETIDANKATAWRAMGFSRISMGSQSFVDDELKAAGRMHRREDTYRAVQILRKAGIPNISLDLIAGLPKQTESSWHTSLQETIALAPEHVSIYMMEIDEGSRLGLEVLQGGKRYSAADLPSEDAMAEFYESAQRELAAAGYMQYEISNWALPGRESLHNLKYWNREPYLGFGAGAHSFSGGRRWANRHDAAAYVEAIEAGKSAVEAVDDVDPAKALEEELFLGLRQAQGVDLGRIERQYGVSLTAKSAQLAKTGMVDLGKGRLRIRVAQFGVSNEIIVELLRAAEESRLSTSSR